MGTGRNTDQRRGDAELSSLTTELGELADRVATMAEPLAGTDDDALASDLFEVERLLREALRRLGHARGRA
jgi:hypothetical protein